MSTDLEKYNAAEQAVLDSEGVAATSRMVDLKHLGGQLRVLEAGEGPPVIMMPGVTNGGAVYAGLVGRLPNFRCIMVDRPGAGLSPQVSPPPKDLAAQERVADALLADLLDGLELDRAHLVSTSLGGWTAFRGAAAHPERVDRFCVLAFQIGCRFTNVPLFLRMPSPTALLPNRMKVGRGMTRASLKSFGMKGSFEKGTFSDELLDWVVALLRYTDTFGNENRYAPRAVRPSGQVDAMQFTPELLAKISAPVHLFWGTDDIFGNHESAQALADMLPKATLQMVEGAGHAPWLDEPELAAEAVRTHLLGG